MNFIDALMEARELENAITYFPGFFNKNFTINMKYSCRTEDFLYELRKNYLKRIKRCIYSSPETEEELENLTRAYAYMNRMVYRKDYIPKEEITKELLSAYNKLINAISNYHFTPHGREHLEVIKIKQTKTLF